MAPKTFAELFDNTTAIAIDKAVENYRALLEKHSREFETDAVQTVLGQSEFADEQFAVFRRHVEVLSNFIVRCVKVIRNRTSQEALDAAGCRQYTDRKVVDAMPKGNGNNQSDDVEVVFFKPEPWEYTRPGYMSDDDLEKCFDRRGLKSADLLSAAAVSEDDPTFADEHPYGTHWKDIDGNWCYVAFNHWHGGRRVSVNLRDNDWSVIWWFAGVRLPAMPAHAGQASK